ncbi:MAG: DUF305 domain-containing protein [Actinomycetota bacterium]|nr:DUF305 domain-containing protein [Actinomycetota bacterium]MDQ3901857.1 DUF305 domain-containing protein [Actinomycetota bacterium]
MRIHRVAAAAVAAAGLLAGCGGTATSPAAAPPQPAGAAPAGSQQRHNQDDVVFLQNMLSHHLQTSTMSDLAHTKATSLRVKTIALRIKAAQDQQITRIHNLLGAWGAPDSARGTGSGEIPGMLTDQQLQQLKSSTGGDFDQLFLQLMIDHQKGAIQMSQTELAQGSDPQARRLAQDTISGQQSEINQMQKLLKPT